jgi:nitrilase
VIITKSTTPDVLREAAVTTQSMFRVAAIQMASGPVVAANLQEAGAPHRACRGDGRAHHRAPRVLRDHGDEGHGQGRRAREGRQRPDPGVPLRAGEAAPGVDRGRAPCRSNRACPTRFATSCLVYNQAGERVARYDKIHLFGFEMGQERYTEERTIEPGSQVMTVDSPYGRLGISVCYDLRFPELYRAMGDVDMIMVPSAFHRDHGQGALGHAHPRAGDREPRLRHRPGPGGLSRERSRNARSYHDRRPVGRRSWTAWRGVRGL